MERAISGRLEKYTTKHREEVLMGQSRNQFGRRRYCLDL